MRGPKYRANPILAMPNRGNASGMRATGSTRERRRGVAAGEGVREFPALDLPRRALGDGSDARRQLRAVSGRRVERMAAGGRGPGPHRLEPRGLRRPAQQPVGRGRRRPARRAAHRGRGEARQIRPRHRSREPRLSLGRRDPVQGRDDRARAFEQTGDARSPRPRCPGRSGANVPWLCGCGALG